MYFLLAMAMPDDSVGEMILRNCPEGEGTSLGSGYFASMPPQSQEMFWLSSVEC